MCPTVSGIPIWDSVTTWSQVCPVSTALETPCQACPVTLNPLLSHPLHICLRCELWGPWPDLLMALSPVGVGSKESVTQMGRGVFVSLPRRPMSLWYYHFCTLLHNNSQPRPQTAGWRWSSSGRPQSWSPRSDRGSHPLCCGFHHC